MDENKLQTTTDWKTLQEVTNNGERVSHLYPNDCYFAHLSIYYFASQFCQNSMVLDAGSGAGYGSAYLAEHGAAHIWGVDVGEKAVEFSKKQFPKANLHYQAMDLQHLTGFRPRQFDLIFTSNTLEHVPDVTTFIRTAWQLLKEDGTMVVAVPPIMRKIDWTENENNIYHLNIWTPRQWFNVLSLFFSEIRPYLHGFNKHGIGLDFNNTPEKTLINEQDFEFTSVLIDDFYNYPTLTAIFTIQKPRPIEELPPSAYPDYFCRGFLYSPFKS